MRMRMDDSRIGNDLLRVLHKYLVIPGAFQSTIQEKFRIQSRWISLLVLEVYNYFTS